MTSEWDEYAAGWDTNQDVVVYSERAFQSLDSVVPLRGLRVLDFGCGTGCLTERLAKVASSVVGLDTSPAMLAVLRAKALQNVETIGAELSPELIATHALLREKFDLVVASSVCGFLPDYEGTLSLLKSLLTRGGVFVQWDWLQATEGSDHGLTELAVRRAFEHAKFDSVSLFQPYSITSPKGETSVLMATGRAA